MWTILDIYCAGKDQASNLTQVDREKGGDEHEDEGGEQLLAEARQGAPPLQPVLAW